MAFAHIVKDQEAVHFVTFAVHQGARIVGGDTNNGKDKRTFS